MNFVPNPHTHFPNYTTHPNLITTTSSSSTVNPNLHLTTALTATATSTQAPPQPQPQRPPPHLPSRYENQKRRDWNTFSQYLRNHQPPLSLTLCSGAHVLEFLRYLDQFGKTKVHSNPCPFFGCPNPPSPCPCPLRQAWGSLDALVGRLRAAFEEHGGRPEVNPFGARAVRLYLRDVKDYQAKARGVSYEKKRKRPPPPPSLLQHKKTGIGTAANSSYGDGGREGGFSR